MMPRDPREFQIDRYVNERLLAYLGGFKALFGRSGWYTGKLQFLAIMDVAFPGQSVLAGAGLTQTEYWLAIGIFWVSVNFYEYLIQWPADMIFGNSHGEDERRSPIRQDTQALLTRLDELEEKIESD